VVYDCSIVVRSRLATLATVTSMALESSTNYCVTIVNIFVVVLTLATTIATIVRVVCFDIRDSVSSMNLDLTLEYLSITLSADSCSQHMM
jgi:hypothetical protein